MKKKIVNGFLMLALLVSSMGSFVSCKDYDEDNYVDLKSQIAGEASLRATLQKQVDAMELRIAELEKAKCNCGDVQAKIEAALTNYLKKSDLDLSAYMKKSDLDLSEYLKKGDVDLDQIANFANLIAALQTQQQELQNQIDALKNAKGSAADALSQEQVDQLVVIINNISNIDATAIAAKATAEQALKLAQENESAITQLKSDFDGKIAQLQGELQAAQTAQQAAQADIADLQARVKVLEDAKKALEEGLEGVKESYATLSASVTKLEGDVVALQGELKTVNEKAAEALAKISTAEGRIDNLEKFYRELKESNESKFGLIDTEIENLKKELAQMKEDWVKDLADNLTAAKEYTDEVRTLTEQAMTKATEALTAAEEAGEKADANSKKLEELEKALENYVSQEDFSKLVSDVQNGLQLLSDEIDEVAAAVEKLKRIINTMVTSIELQGVECPVIGYLSLPFNLQTNILAAYYGETGGFGMEFPTELARFYVDPATTFDDRDFDVMGIESFEDVKGYVTKSANSKFLGEKDGQRIGNAGKVYVTVNPSNVDFEGKTLTLVNSQGEAAPIVLEPLKKSSEILQFGYGVTRSFGYDDNNNFYEATASLPYKAIDEAKLKINVSEVKELAKSAKSALENRDKNGILNAGVSFTRVMTDAALTRYGVKAVWQTNDEGGVRSTVSQLGLAATAVKPLSFNFLRDIQVTKVPGIDRIEKLVAEMINKIEIEVPNIEFDINKYFTFKDVEILEGNKVVVTGTGKINGKTKTVTVTVYLSDADTETLEQLVESMTVTTSNGSKISVDIAELLNDIQELSTLDTQMEVSIADAKQNMIDGINEYIDKANSKLCKIINSANKALQPAMVVSQDKKAALLSQSVALPTIANGEVNLFPTSYTLEFFAPAFKKFVAVTDVYDAATKTPLPLSDAVSLAKEANSIEGMMSVEDGNYLITFNGKKGYIYEIAYSAVDYDGLVVLKKFYIQF